MCLPVCFPGQMESGLTEKNFLLKGKFFPLRRTAIGKGNRMKIPKVLSFMLFNEL